MYIEITQAFADQLDDSGIGPMWEILSNIHLALRKGSHIIVCEKRAVAKTIVKKSLKRIDIQSDFESIENDLSVELRTLRNSLDRFYSLIPQQSTDFSQTGKNIKIGIDLALNDSFWQESSLVVEYETDYIYYKMIADYEKNKTKENQFIDIIFNPVSGGGLTSLNVFESIRKKNAIVFGIVDSDRDFDGGPLGSTAKAYVSCDTTKTILSDYMILGTREIENLFYSKSFIEGLDIDNSTKRSVEEKMKVALTHDPKFELFYDIKSGYNKKSIALKPKLMEILEAPACCQNASEKNCKKCKNNNCNTIVLKALSKDYMKLLRAKYCEKSSKANFAQDAYQKNSNLNKIWNDLGKKLLCWGCGKKMNTRGI